jgi:transcriptional regulator with XRE-family HTH domain
MTTSHGERRTQRGWTVDASTLGARLALVRHRMNWNVKEAARECGVPAASWRSWEEGAQPRRVFEVLSLIAERTGADYMWLLMGDQAPGAAGSTGTGSADTLQTRHVTERRSPRVTGHGPRSSERSHKPDTARHDTRRPRILPQPSVGAA